MLVELMKLGKEEVPACTSLDVAETFGKGHDHVLRDIRELGCSKEFRLSSFGESTYVNAQGRKQPMFVMNRDGFTLLVMGYTGDKAMRFKEAYIRQFNAMERLNQGRKIEREKGIVARQTLTKSLQLSVENERMHGYAYPVYTNCIYKALFGKNAKQLREEYGVPQNTELRDCLSAEDLAAIKSMECLVSGLVDFGWGYDQVKEFIMQTNTRRLSA